MGIRPCALSQGLGVSHSSQATALCGHREHVDCGWKSGGGTLLRTVLTGKDLMDHTISLFSGTHLTLPTVVLNLGESASLGTGMWISTLLAVDRRLNWLLA